MPDLSLPGLFIAYSISAIGWWVFNDHKPLSQELLIRITYITCAHQATRSTSVDAGLIVQTKIYKCLCKEALTMQAYDNIRAETITHFMVSSIL